MKKETKQEAKKIFGEVTLSILDIICSIPEALIGSFIDRNEITKLMNTRGEYKSIPVNYLNDLIHRGYIESKIEDGRTSIRLTHKGKIRQIEGSREFIRDGKWRFLSFDIPEKRSKDRNHFRRSIKRFGFRQVQKSLWVCPYIKADKIDLIIDELDLRDFVCYISADKTDIDEHLGKLFEK